MSRSEESIISRSLPWYLSCPCPCFRRCASVPGLSGASLLPRYQALRGTRDILPGEVEKWQRVERIARALLDRYGFREIRTPIIEPTELFVRSVGGSTDIVRKEMFTLVLSEDSVSLRPEGTAPVVRAFVQAGLDRVAGADRLYYIGPMFRYERPQKGRQRQFHQIGVEVIGSDDPLVDAETIEMLLYLLEELGVSETSLALNSVGDAVCRPGYREALRAYLAPRLALLCADCNRRYEENPLRVFDCKVESCRQELAAAPAMLDHLCEDCRRHFDSVRSYLDRFGIEYMIDPRLVRGLDYYVRTAFELLSEQLGAQNSLMGGGRYDGLVKEMGGKDLPGFGWALGLERLMMLLPADRAEATASADILIAPLDAPARTAAALAARTLRRAGVRVLLEAGERSLTSHLRRADRLGVPLVLIIGEQEVAAGGYTLRDMRSGEQRPVPVSELTRLAEEILREA